MATIEEIKYLEQKRKNVIRIVKQFRKAKGNHHFPHELNQDTLDLDTMFCNADLCSKCNCICCTISPCFFSPYDFLDLHDLDYMRTLLNTGLLCISHPSAPELFASCIIRPRGIWDEEVVSTVYGANPCILEGDNGCLLPTQYRPCQGLLYYPYKEDKETKHLIMYSDSVCAKDYQSYQDTLLTLIHEYRGVSIPYHEHSIEEQANQFVKNLIRK